jgi:SAM-dependent methyltransferase
VTTCWNVRTAIGRSLTGDVLEIGPGHVPFPIGDGARVTYADRSIDGGRDANFPELVGEPHGPDAHVDLDLDRDGLRTFADGSFDGVVASHMIEHLANPVSALVEFWRVLRPGGRLVLLVPDREHTFDAGRAPTPLAHVLEEHHRGVTAVDEAHIREFCAALYAGPVIHPPEVRDWHDPERLDDERLELHRRRSIHVHCWTPEEFATLVLGMVAAGLGAWALRDVYLRDDIDEEDGIEFGLVLERPPVAAGDASTQAAAFAAAWAAAVASDPRRDPARLARLSAAVRRDLDGLDPAAVAVQGAVLAAVVDEIARLRARVAAGQEAAESIGERARAAEARAAAAEARAVAAEEADAVLRASRSFRVAGTLSAMASTGRRAVGRLRRGAPPPTPVGRHRAGAASVVVARVDVHAGDALGVEHVHVAAVVLEREPQVEAQPAQVVDGLALEGARRRVVAVVAHDQHVPAQLVAVEPGQGLRAYPQGPGGEQHDVEGRVDDVEQAGHLVDELVVATGREEGVPVAAGVVEEVLAAGGVGEHAVHVEDHGLAGMVERALAPRPVLGCPVEVHQVNLAGRQSISR